MKKVFAVIMAIVFASSMLMAANIKSEKAKAKEKKVNAHYADLGKSFDKYKNKLNLTPQQVESIAKTDSQYKKKQEILKEKISQAKSAKSKAVEKKDGVTVAKRDNTLKKLEKKGRDNAVDYGKSLSSVLTDEQNDKLNGLIGGKKKVKEKSKK